MKFLFLSNKNIWVCYFLIIFLSCSVFFCACSKITRDYYFSHEQENQWTNLVFPGSQESVKEAPIPDQAFVQYQDKKLRMQISGEYTSIHWFGPLWFPIIPFLENTKSNEMFSLDFIVESKEKPIFLDFSKFRFYLNGEETPSHFVLSYQEKGKKINIKEDSLRKIGTHSKKEFSFQFIKNPQKIEKIVFVINGVKTNEEKITVPKLILNKRKGSYNYDEFTL